MNELPKFSSEAESLVTKEYTVDALAHVADEGRRRLRKASGSCQSSFDPGMSEWGNLL